VPSPAPRRTGAVLGLLDPGAFLGGDMPLDGAAATAAVASLGDVLELDAPATAAGIHDIVAENMAAAARMHAVEQGVDLRGVPLLAFGGAGPVHACAVAELLESDRVVFPVNASVLSAFGTLVSPVRIDLARSMPRRFGEIGAAERDALLDDLRSEGRRVLSAAGADAGAIRFRYGLDARYTGQGNEVTVWVGEGSSWPASDEQVLAAFEREYRRIYGLTIPDVGIEAVTWRLSAVADAAAFEPRSMPTGRGAAPSGRRRVVLGRGAAAVEAPVYRRIDLGAGDRFDGPAVVEERETTAVIRPGWSVSVAADGSLVAVRTRTSADETETVRA
jgi:N-methylhydantoinase A